MLLFLIRKKLHLDAAESLRASILLLLLLDDKNLELWSARHLNVKLNCIYCIATCHKNSVQDGSTAGSMWDSLPDGNWNLIYFSYFLW